MFPHLQELQRQAEYFEGKEKQLLRKIDQEREKINNPTNPYKDNKFNELVNKLTREKDPKYRVAAEKIDLQIKRIHADRMELFQENGL